MIFFKEYQKHTPHYASITWKKKQTSNSERGQNLKPPLFSIDPQKQVNSMQESEVVALLREEKKQGQN